MTAVATLRKRKTSKGETRWAWRVSVKRQTRYGTAPTKEGARALALRAELELLAAHGAASEKSA